MAADNVVDASDRFASLSATGGRRSSLDRAVEQLRSTARLATEDRPVLARGLGRLAAKIKPEAPLEGAKMMFKHTGWEEKWPKRKRLVRLPDEPADESSDYGSYEGGGPAYLALADAAAAMLADNDSPSSHDLDKARREMLRGTTLLPGSAPLPTSAFAARELLDEWAARLCARLQAETRLPELMKILEVSPFTTEVLGSGWQKQVDQSVLESARSEPAGEAALGANAIAKYNWKEGTTIRFTATNNSGSLSWANPSIRIGILAGKVSIPTFLFPREISEILNSKAFSDDGIALPMSLLEWFASIGMDRTEVCNREMAEWCEKSGEKYSPAEKMILGDFPLVAWSMERRYGWKNLEYYRLANVWITLTQISDNVFQIYCSFEGLEDEPSGPFIPAFNFKRDKEVSRYISGKIYNEYESSIFETVDDKYSRLHWPDLPEYGEDRGKLIGVIDSWQSGEPFENWCRGWLDDSQILDLLLTDESWQFYPQITCPNAPVPCPAQSAAAAMLRNLAGAPDESRIDNMLLAQANEIAQVGLAYYEALVDHYRSAVLKP